MSCGSARGAGRYILGHTLQAKDAMLELKLKASTNGLSPEEPRN
jgi:hypothetical protein